MEAFARTRLGGQAVKHVVARYRQKSTWPFETTEEIFSNLNRLYGDSHKKQTTSSKRIRDLKQGGKYREFSFSGPNSNACLMSSSSWKRSAWMSLIRKVYACSTLTRNLQGCDLAHQDDRRRWFRNITGWKCAASYSGQC